MVWHDVTKIKDEESIDIIRSQIDIIARKIQEDTEMYIVCEMAKKYLEGARPVYYKERPTGKWTRGYDGCSHYLFCSECNHSRQIEYYYGEIVYPKFCEDCGAKMKRSEEA